MFHTRPSLTAAAVIAFPFLVAAGWLALLIYANAHEDPHGLCLEDGFFEWHQVAQFAACGALAFLAAGRAGLTNAQRVCLVAFGVLMLLAVGEELSWGQRIIDVEAHEVVGDRSDKVLQIGHGDLAVHNLTIKTDYFKFSVGGALFGVLMLAALAAHGIAMPLLLRRGHAGLRRLVDRTGLFVPPLDLGILVTVCVAIVVKRRLWPGVEANEFKESIVPFVYAFVLVRLFFATGDRLGRAVSWIVIVGTTAYLAWTLYYFHHHPPTHLFRL